ncbi:glycoside hydrolase family 32 protein [Mediterraneibacter gnavus]|uniref:glycoside hydrolase family 32 protein n=1 Tax=Mediterraneibacter gnavus TaxID=33038 RepID=UPI0036D266AA
MQAEKKPMTKKQYFDKCKKFDNLRNKVASDPYRMKFHLQPPLGWLNDPNGLCQIGSQYHIYFQYTPFNPNGGTGLWGHMVTEDFIHYEEHEPSIFPDSSWDANGAYSGSAYEENGEYYFFYTGNVKYEGEEYNYITDGREQNVILTITKDGYNFSKKQLIMTNSDFPEDMSKHVRDPQIIKRGNHYYMILGARDLSDKGSVVLFKSNDLYHWKYELRFTTQDVFGYMWECPNYVEIDGKQFLIVCPQGIKQNGLDYANAHQCGYFPLNYKFEDKTYQLGEFCQLDRGFDFYAPQVFKDHKVNNPASVSMLSGLRKPQIRF